MFIYGGEKLNTFPGFYFKKNRSDNFLFSKFCERYNCVILYYTKNI